MIDDVRQGPAALPAQAAHDFQITAGVGVEDDTVLAALELQAADVGQRAALGVLGVLQQAARGADGEFRVFEAEGGKIPGAELRAQRPPRAVAVEMPGRHALDAGAALESLQGGGVLAQQQLRRLQPFQLRGHRLRAIQLHGAVGPGGQLQRRQAETALGGVQGAEQILLPLLQQRLLGERSRSDNACDPPLHRSPALGRIADLLADGHGFPLAHQLGQIGLHRVHRHPGHGDGFAVGLAAPGQGDVQQRGRPPGIVEKQLVEVPHAVKQENVGMLRLDAEILPDDGRVLGFGV